MTHVKVVGSEVVVGRLSGSLDFFEIVALSEPEPGTALPALAQRQGVVDNRTSSSGNLGSSCRTLPRRSKGAILTTTIVTSDVY